MGKINRISLSLFWLILTVSLAIWWFTLGLRQTKTISELSLELGEPNQYSSSGLLEKQSRMLWMEGTFFISMLTLGGSVLIWFSYQDIKRNQLIQDFFSTVTHEMKTPLAGLRLQVEGLMEDLSGSKEYSNILKRALKESDRIESQMDKAFYLASLMRSETLFIEKVSINSIKYSLQDTFPDVKWTLAQESFLKVDKRAMESIFSNLLENAYKHGLATKIHINVEPIVLSKSDLGIYQERTSLINKYLGKKQSHEKHVKISIKDNGRGFQGNLSHIGKPFIRSSSTSGSGIGLYIVKQLISKMNGKIFFHSDTTGFEVRIELPTF
ncbi:MAG: HAMP domain-containing histidine kinase [Leptospiraceae bacterium]|nr:HAMP domain-containing histidine kinase [Leptospiraceae bacterium]